VGIKLTGCMGACTLGPTLIINPGMILYCNLAPSDMRLIVKDHIRKGKIVEKLCFKDKVTGKPVPHLNDIDFFRHQKKHVLQNCGVIDFASIEEYIAHDGYFAIEKALKIMKPADVIEEIKKIRIARPWRRRFPRRVKMGNGQKSCKWPEIYHL